MQSKSLFEEPTNIVYICLAIGVVLAFLVFLTCMIYKKHLYVCLIYGKQTALWFSNMYVIHTLSLCKKNFRLNVKVESKTEIQHKREKEEKIPKEEMKNYAWKLYNDVNIHFTKISIFDLVSLDNIWTYVCMIHRNCIKFCYLSLFCYYT